MKFVQVLFEKAHWIFEADERPEFAPDIMLVDITNMDPQPEEGWLYSNGTFISPEAVIPYSERLEAAKAAKLNAIYASFEAAKQAVVWTEQYGYDADKDSLADFRNAKDRARDLRDAWVANGKQGDEPTVPYRVYLRPSGKAFVPHSHDLFVLAQETGAVQQMAAFVRFDELRVAIEAAETVEEVQTIVW